jgi:uncharacterized membrane protein YqjE
MEKSTHTQTTGRGNREEALQMEIREELALRFKDFPLLVTLALWLCLVPIIVILIGWIWGFWEALIGSLAVLVVMIILCLVFCLRIRLRLEKTSDLSVQGSGQK